MPEINQSENYLYKENLDFTNKKIDKPVNVDEIRRNVLLRLYGNDFDNLYLRIAKGIAWILVMIIVTYVGVTAIVTTLSNSILWVAILLIIITPPSIYMCAIYALRYLSDKTKELDSWVERLLTQGKTVTGRIKSHSETNTGTLIYFSYSTPEESSIFSKYLLKEKISINNEQSVTVLYCERLRVLL